MTPERAPRPSRDEVLLDFATHEQASNPEVLTNYIKRFPEYASDLAQLSVDLMRVAAEPCVALSAEDIAAEEQALAVAAAEEAGLAAPAIADPFAQLTPEDTRRIATELGGVRLSFVGMLKERLIDVATMPSAFLARLATILSTSVEALKESLSANVQFAAATEFKSDSRPQAAAKMSFEEAMDEAELTDAQKRDLRGQ